MRILSILTKKMPFEPGKKPIRLFLYVDDDKSGRGVARAGGRSGRGGCPGRVVRFGACWVDFDAKVVDFDEKTQFEPGKKTNQVVFIRR